MPTRRFHRYVAIGDSTTEGLDDPDGQGGYRGWANRLAEHVARTFGAVEYANLAVRGLTTRQILQTQLAPALALEPDLATMVSGVNDLLRPRFDADAVAADQSAMIHALLGVGATVLSFTMPDFHRVMPMARVLRGRLEALNARLRTTCERAGALLVDLADNAVAGDPRLWSDDRLHANSLGHERIAAGLAHRLGLPGFDEHWADPLPDVLAPSLATQALTEVRWARAHLVPWILRHARGQSSSDGRTAKRPALAQLVHSEPDS